MSDDDIIARGGTQDDIDSYAERNGAMNPTNQSKQEELQGEIWSKSLKYLDYMAHQSNTGEEYYAYRDDKARELSEDIMQLIQSHDEAREREIRIDELRTLWPKFTDIQFDGTNGPEDNQHARRVIDNRIADLTTHPNEHGEE